MKQPDYFLTANPKKAACMLVLRADKPVGLPESALAYGYCMDCKARIVFNKLNKGTKDLPKICNECFERHSGMTVLQLALSDPLQATIALERVVKDIKKAWKNAGV